jgi:hypothetical protein
MSIPLSVSHRDDDKVARNGDKIVFFDTTDNIIGKLLLLTLLDHLIPSSQETFLRHRAKDTVT